MLLYAPVITPRLRYMASFAGTMITGQPLALTDNNTEAQNYQGPLINYSSNRVRQLEYHIYPQGLLFETGIKSIKPEVTVEDGLPAFFITAGQHSFDVLAASFYLISRYEEYLPSTPDSYGRFDHRHSLAWQAQFLDRPLVNEWMNQLRAKLAQQFGTLPQPPRPVSFLPTYDIDIAWSYLHKGWLRTLGAGMAALIKGNWKQLKERLQVLRGRAKDPFDAYGWMNQLHERLKLKPYYFFLLAPRRGRYDKNISPTHKAMQALVADHLIRYPVGIHPSWRSGDDPAQLQAELQLLAQLSGQAVQSSRQHYIRMQLPQTYRRLVAAGIGFDFSMGYGSINGFRASVASPFYWYDLEKEEQTALLLFPFCYMEANSFYEQKYTAQQALTEMRHYRDVVANANGTLITVWHNNFLGSDTALQEWKQIYQTFLEETAAASQPAF